MKSHESYTMVALNFSGHRRVINIAADDISGVSRWIRNHCWCFENGLFRPPEIAGSKAITANCAASRGGHADCCIM